MAELLKKPLLKRSLTPIHICSQDYASTIGSGPEESVAEVGVSADAAAEAEALDVTTLNKVFLITCDISPCSCSTVILELSRDILASCDSSCKGESNHFFYT